MPTAFVLINCELGSEQYVISELKSLQEVVEVSPIFGVYDMIVKLHADTSDKLKELITWKIRRTDKIKSTLTLIEIEGKEKKERTGISAEAKGKWRDVYGSEKLTSNVS